MKRVLGRTASLLVLVLAVTAAAAAQDRPDTTSAASQPRFTLEAAAGFQTYYRGSTQSIAFGFALTRHLTLLVGAERSFVADRIELYEDGYSSERGGTEQFVGAEVRYAFVPRKRIFPYLVGGTGRGISRPNVNEFFPDKKERGIQVLYYGGGVRMPVGPRLDAFVDARIIMAVESRSDYFGVRFPVRGGIAWRF